MGSLAVAHSYLAVLDQSIDLRGAERLVADEHVYNCLRKLPCYSSLFLSLISSTVTATALHSIIVASETISSSPARTGFPSTEVSTRNRILYFILPPRKRYYRRRTLRAAPE